MKCPYCEKEMDEGYIQGGQGVLFSPNEKVIFVLKNPFSKKDVKITGLFDNSARAFYCYPCECLIWKKSVD